MSGLGTSSITLLPESEKTEINSVCYSYFLELLQFCEDMGIPVLCVYLPYGAEEMQQRVANTIGDIICEYPHHAYVNMLDKNILNFLTDIHEDNGHLNYSGARKTTAWLGSYISEKYEMDDYSRNEYWKEDYWSYYQYKVKNLTSQTKLVNYLLHLGDSDFSAQMDIHDMSFMESDVIKALVENAGISVRAAGDLDDEYCARLRVVSNLTHEIVCDVSFTNEEVQ